MKIPHPANSSESAEIIRLRILQEESRHHREISRRKLDEEIKTTRIRRWFSVAVIIAGISLTVFAFIRGYDIAAGMIGAATIGGFLRSGK